MIAFTSASQALFSSTAKASAIDAGYSGRVRGHAHRPRGGEAGGPGRGQGLPTTTQWLKKKREGKKTKKERKKTRVVHNNEKRTKKRTEKMMRNLICQKPGSLAHLIRQTRQNFLSNLTDSHIISFGRGRKEKKENDLPFFLLQLYFFTTNHYRWTVVSMPRSLLALP